MIIRNIIVAFSMYSRIPMPIFEWKKDDTKLAIAFLPLIGLVIGAVQYGVYLLGNMFELPTLLRVMLWTVIPLLLTGGFHVDGFMDVMDAWKSYKPKEEKLEILKDPHIGAFSVICLAAYGCLFVGATDMLIERGTPYSALSAALSFYLVRAIASLLSVKLKHARKNGMLHEETKETGRVTTVIIVTELLLGLAALLLLDYKLMLGISVVMLLFIFYFWKKCEKELGGITGDTIGYFVTQGELWVHITIAAFILLNAVL